MRERLSKLSSLPLLRGTNVTAERQRLRRQLRRDLAPSRRRPRTRSGRSSSSRAIPTGPTRSTTSQRILDDWVELHGDRGRADDGALVTGLGRLDGRTVALVGHQKGRDLKERLDRQYGMAYPEGYAKAMRTMELAERFGFPVLSLVDTPGAYPGVAAEQHGQGGAIARSQARMARLERADASPA